MNYNSFKMPRPRRQRRIGCAFRARQFKPAGVPLRGLEQIALGEDELEALRLVDALGHNQQKAATTMNISQPTLNRILASARQKSARALSEGLALTINNPPHTNSQKNSGGERMPNKDGTGPEGKGPMTGRKLGPCNPEASEEIVQPLRRGRGQGPCCQGRGVGQGRGQGLIGRRQN